MGGVICATLTILICIALIPVCKKYIPWFTAQKDLIHFDPSHSEKNNQCCKV